jgi:hypothetical protein
VRKTPRPVLRISWRSFFSHEKKAAGADLVALAVHLRFPVAGEHEKPLIGAAMPVRRIAFGVAGLEHHFRRLGKAVAGDHAESPAKPQLLAKQNPCDYFVPVPVLLPEPEPELDPPLVPMPVLGEVVLVLGEVGLVVVEPDMPLPLAPAPAEPERLSCRHFSRSAPVNPTHLLGTSVDAPLAAEPVEPLVPREPLVSVEPLVPPADAPPTLEPDVPLAPVEPEDEPDDCAIVTEERARSAAAVAAARVFNIMIWISSKRIGRV